MNKTEIFDTLYFTDNSDENDKKRISDPQNWITRFQPFSSPVIAKAFIGPKESIPMYIAVDKSAPETFITNVLWWGFNNGIIVDVVDEFDLVPFSVKSAGKAMTKVQRHIAEIAAQN